MSPKKYRALSEEQWTAAAMRYEAGDKPKNICADFGISMGSLNWNMLRLGADKPDAKPLPARAPGPPIVRRGAFEVRHFTADEDRRIQERSVEGWGNTRIGREIGRPANSVKGRLMTLARHEARREAAAGGALIGGTP